MALAHPSFEFRPGQLDMARAVEKTLASGGELLAEAGTGTGKTLAYLVPAVQSGRRVVVSTATRNLQEQIARKEVPFLRNRLGLDFTAMTMKGRDNYLCVYRFREFEREPRFRFVDEVEPYGLVRDWAEETTVGDRAEVPGLPDRARFWREINARSDTCVGKKCPAYDECFLVKMRRRAEETQVLIVNHSLLFADIAVRTGDFGQVIPDYDALILDEGHRVEAIATQHFGRRLSSYQVRDLTDDVSRHVTRDERGLLEAVASVTRHAEQLFAAFADEREGRHRLRADGLHREAVAMGAALRQALGRLARELRPRLIDGREDEDELRQGLRRRCEDLRLEAEDVLEGSPEGDVDESVRWFEVRGGGVVLHASPIDVSEPLRRHLFEPLHAAVVTSATLTVKGSFDFVRKRLGLDDAEALHVESPFDYDEQGLLYLPSDLPEPRSPEYIEAVYPVVRRLLEISDGRAFLLFTSFANLNAMKKLLADDSSYRLLVQGDAPREFLLERFTKTHQAVLLGTSSFWEGVDVPGEALSLVIIDRLPFAVPDDPLLSARLDGIRRRGGEPFSDYQVPEAVLALKQGAGRLIRTRTDTGVLCILDPRLVRKSYGAAFRASLPPFRVTTDMDAVRWHLKEEE